ncbi:MAG TPA: hypothetical protein HPP87_09030 [Planctomycetes bacterium]|nr:hypothetical protein [Planctomycetota bacterium]
MSYSFDEANAAFKADKIGELAQDSDGLRFLKLRSLSRIEFMKRLAQGCGLELPSVDGRKDIPYLRFLFDSEITNTHIEETINTIYAEERQSRLSNEDELVSELYRLEVFDWGGLHQNSLERAIVDNYVKKITSYGRLCECIEDELHHSMRSYVLCSWYNHWTSRIIEDIFRDHACVLPAVGLIKKIDFFINDVPFDLKVTYMPEGYIKDNRKAESLRPEITLLKRFCRENNIHFERTLPEARLLEDLWTKVNDHPLQTSRELITNLREKRSEYLRSAIENPIALIRWLYENQGVRRFDASNRLFLVLLDCNNFFESWKLKRAKPLLEDRIHSHLDNMGSNPGHEVSFSWEGIEYNTTSDVIFVTRENG